MAENQLRDLLETQIPTPGRSMFNRGYINRFTASPGYGYPVGLLEVLPNTRVRCKLDAIVKSDPLVSSLFGTFRQSWQAFFVPSRLYVKELDQNHRNGITNSDLENVKFPVIRQGFVSSTSSTTSGTIKPLIMNGASVTPGLDNFAVSKLMNRDVHKDAIFCTPGSVLETFGYLPSDFNLCSLTNYTVSGSTVNFDTVSQGLNAIPFIGYYDIYRNYYQNQQQPLQQFVMHETFTSTAMDPTNYDFDSMIDGEVEIRL